MHSLRHMFLVIVLLVVRGADVNSNIVRHDVGDESERGMLRSLYYSSNRNASNYNKNSSNYNSNRRGRRMSLFSKLKCIWGIVLILLALWYWKKNSVEGTLTQWSLPLLLGSAAAAEMKTGSDSSTSSNHIHLSKGHTDKVNVTVNPKTERPSAVDMHRQQSNDSSKGKIQIVTTSSQIRRQQSNDSKGKIEVVTTKSPRSMQHRHYRPPSAGKGTKVKIVVNRGSMT